MLARIKRRTHEILNVGAAGDRASRLFDIFIISLIGLTVPMLILETVPSLAVRYRLYFLLFDEFSLAVFALEYLLRVWACTSDPRFSEPVRGRLRYMRTPMALVDLLAVLPAFMPFFLTLDMRAARAVRLFRIFRLLKLARYSQSLQLLGRVFHERREELLIVLLGELVLLVFGSSLIYFVEHDAQPDAFSSIPASMWWAVVTLTTVGYGDVAPITVPGRICAGLLAVGGVATFALPAGIMAAGFADQAARLRTPPKCPSCGASLGVAAVKPGRDDQEREVVVRLSARPDALEQEGQRLHGSIAPPSGPPPERKVG